MSTKLKRFKNNSFENLKNKNYLIKKDKTGGNCKFYTQRRNAKKIGEKNNCSNLILQKF